MSDTETLTFGVYPGGPDCEHDPFAVMNAPGPTTPRGTLEAIQDHVREAAAAGDLTVDGGIEEAGEVTYEPGKDDGRVTDVTLYE